VIGTSYFADGAITADAPDGKPFRRVIAQLPTISRSIDRNALGGAISTSIGSMRLNNTDGRLNALRDAVVDGQQCRILLGDESWAVCRLSDAVRRAHEADRAGHRPEGPLARRDFRRRRVPLRRGDRRGADPDQSDLARADRPRARHLQRRGEGCGVESLAPL
jgi:hypothetical protein